MSYNYIGPYDNTTIYYFHNIVSYNNSTFICVNDISGSGISGSATTDSNYWSFHDPEIVVIPNDIVYKSIKLSDRYISDDYSYKKIKIPKIDKIELPTDSDYKRGYMYRYFFRQLNNEMASIYEITKSEHGKIANHHFYSAIRIMWKLIGEKSSALKTNIEIIRDAENKLSGIKNILSGDPLKYWKNLPDIIPEDKDVTDQIVTNQKNKVYKLTQEFIKHMKNKTIRSSAEFELIKNEFLRESEVDAVTAGVLEYSEPFDENQYLRTEADDIILTEDYQAILVELRT